MDELAAATPDPGPDNTITRRNAPTTLPPSAPSQKRVRVLVPPGRNSKANIPEVAKRPVSKDKSPPDQTDDAIDLEVARTPHP
jgi:hypothetical protein